MKTQKILKFMKELDNFILEVDKKIPTRDKKVSPDFIRVIEGLMKRDTDFNLEKMDLSKHVIVNEDGSFYLSEPLQESIIGE